MVFGLSSGEDFSLPAIICHLVEPTTLSDAGKDPHTKGTTVTTVSIK
jgi:hypothetical protein